MPIDNATWYARVDSFCALKTLCRYKSKTRKVAFSFQTVYFLFLALPYIFKSILNNAHYFFNFMLTKNMSLTTKLTNIFLFICIANLLGRCGDIETNPGHLSSLNFCHWNLMVSQLMILLKSHYFKPIFSSIIMTSYVYQKRF